MSLCAECGADYRSSAAEDRLRAGAEPFVGGVRLALPPSPLCHDCRLRWRYAFRNDWHYYRRACDRCHAAVVSIYAPSVSFPVYCPECFWRDDWSAVEYGRDFDFNRGFFEQYLELQQAVPRISIYHTNSEGSDYSIHSTRNKRCYLVSSVHESENVLYADLSRSCRDSLDLYSTDSMELCYECVFSLNCYDSEFLEHCLQLTSSTLCCDCRNSDHLIGCIGLRSESCCILNQQSTRDECERTRLRLFQDPEFATAFREQFARLVECTPHPAHWQMNCEDSTGSYLRNCSQADNCLNTRNLESCSRITEASICKDCVSSAHISKAERLYECHGCVETSTTVLSHLTYNCSDMIYCDNCQAGSQSCFGSISLTRERHCILNQPHTPESYATRVAEIVDHMRRTGEWGYFFPPYCSPFGYNETKASVWFPLTQQEVAARGWRWSDYDPPPPAVRAVIEAAQLPDAIADVDDSVLSAAIVCEASRKPFRLTSYEFEFYRKKGLPVPRRSPWRRQLDRVSRFARRARSTVCHECSTPIEAYHPAEAAYPIFCDACYLAHIHG